MLVDQYEKLHSDYIVALVDYHNEYIKYIKGKQTKKDYQTFRRALRRLQALNGQMLKEIYAIKQGKVELYKDNYQTQRSKGKNKNDNNSRTN